MTQDPVQGFFDVSRHTIPHCPDAYPDGTPFSATVFIRSKDCLVLCGGDMCEYCLLMLTAKKQRQTRKTARKSTAVQNKAPLPVSSKERLVVTVQKQRMQCKDLKSRLADMEKEIKSNSIKVYDVFESDIKSILANFDMDSSTHVKFF